jgi:zinc transporter ZupT
MSLQALILGGIPAFCMVVSTYIGLGVVVPEDVEGALQHFAAGVLLCTVGTELLPEMVKAEGLAENIAAMIGFFFGVAVLIILGMFAPQTENDQKGGSTPHTEPEVPTKVLESSPTFEQKLQIRQSKFVIAGRRFRQRQTPLRSNSSGMLVMKRSMSLSSLPTATESDNLLSDSGTPVYAPYTEDEEKPKKAPLKRQESSFSDTRASMLMKAFPLQFMLAVAIDSCLDGLLIGIASAAGRSAGPMMSASLSVEMGFLGLTLASALSGQPFSKASIAALVGPFCRESKYVATCPM